MVECQVKGDAFWASGIALIIAKRWQLMGWLVSNQEIPSLTSDTFAYLFEFWGTLKQQLTSKKQWSNKEKQKGFNIQNVDIALTMKLCCSTLFSLLSVVWLFSWCHIINAQARVGTCAFHSVWVAQIHSCLLAAIVLQVEHKDCL